MSALVETLISALIFDGAVCMCVCEPLFSALTLTYLHLLLHSKGVPHLTESTDGPLVAG